jgi:hypothetical protein
MDQVQQDKSDFSLWLFIPKTLGVFLLVLPVCAAIGLPKVMECSDFMTSFYVAGQMVLSGKASDLYPSAQTTSLIFTAFNATAHQILHSLPQPYTAIYMYSPLIACLFAPLAFLSPQMAMIVWQLISIAALAGSAALLSAVTKDKFAKLFFVSLFFLPVLQTLLIGHIGLAMGVLPLAVGYFFLMRKQPLMAGLVWSILFLKPQFVPTVLLVVGSLLLTGRFKCSLGLAIGLVVLSVLSVFCLTPAVFHQWLLSLKLSDTIFSNPQYGYPVYLITSLPAAILHAFPMSMRNIVKLPSYALAAVIGLHALWLCYKLLKSNVDEYRVLPYVMLLGMFVAPLVLPHFLAYDLCIFVPAAMICLGHRWQPVCQFELKRLVIFVFVVVDVYVILFMSGLKALASPYVLVAFLIAAYARLLIVSRADVAVLE